MTISSRVRTRRHDRGVASPVLSRRQFSVAAAAAALTAAAGCSSSGSSASGGQVTLTYGIWEVSEAPAMRQIAKEFEKSHPNIKIRVALTPWDSYWTKLQTAATGGSAPDVFWLNLANFKLYASNGVILPLTKMIKSDHIDLGNYYDTITTGYQWKGDQYALPKDIDTICLWYNKKLFDAAGMKYPDTSWTWDNVATAATKLTDRSKGVYGIAAALADQTNFYDTILQAGGQIISADGRKSGYDSDAAIAGLSFWTDLILKYHASPTLAQMTDTEPQQMFSSGKVAMYYGGSWEALALKDVPYAVANAGVTVMPKGKVRATVSNGLGNVVYAKTKHPKEAWEFVKFLGSKEAALIQARTGTVIPAYKGTADIWVKSIPQFDLTSFVDELSYAHAYPASVNTPVWQDYVVKQLPAAWTGKKSVSSVASDIGSFMNNALSKEKR